MFHVWQDRHKSTQGWKVSFWGLVRGKFSVNNKMNDFVGNILQNKFYAYGCILLSRTRRSTGAETSMLLNCRGGQLFCCSGATLRRPHLAEGHAKYWCWGYKPIFTKRIEGTFRYEDFPECFCGPLKTLRRATLGPRAAICPPMAYCIK